MAIISGTVVDWTVNPRVITIPASDTEATIDDLQDTLLDIEDTEEGIVFKHLRATSGGEALGGGVTVGLTMELQDAQLAFATRVTQLESGTVTTPDVNGITLIDSTALFQSSGVSVGDIIRNHTDAGSVASVRSIDSEVQITTNGLSGGTDDQFDSNDIYDVMDWVQCNITGGNLVAVDGNGSAIDPVFPTFGTQVVRTAASSATLQSQTALEHSVFGGSVVLDINNDSGLAALGTVYPAGTTLQPCLNMTDATAIAVTQGFDLIVIRGNATIDATISMDNYRIMGSNSASSSVTFSTADTGDMSIENCSITGSMNGALFANRCEVVAITGVGCTTNETVFTQCSLEESIIMRSDNTKDFHIDNCSGTPGFFLDMNNTVADVFVDHFSGDMEIRNLTNALTIHYTSDGGTITIASSCTSGTIDINGGTLITDNNGGTTVLDNTVISVTKDNILEQSIVANAING